MQQELCLYVTPDAQNGDGTQAHPFSTITEARNYLRENRRSGQSAVVIFTEGRHFISDTIAFDSRDSGTAENPVIYRAAPGCEVFFDGGRIVPAERIHPLTDPVLISRLAEPSAAKQILCADLKGLAIHYGSYGNRGFRRPYIPAPNELFIDHTPYTVARYPKKEDGDLPLNDIIDGGSTPRSGDFSMRPITIRYDNARIEKWTEAHGACLSGYFASSFADDNIEIASIDGKKRTITTKLPHLYGAVAEPFANFHIVNLFEEITQPGEYYVDTEREAVYFIPENGFDANRSLIQISSLDRVMFAFEGAAYIRFEGFTLENSRATGIYIEGGEGLRVEKCTFRCLGMLAIQMGKGASPMPEGRHTYHGIRDKGIEAPHPIPREMGCWHEYIYEFAAWDNDAGKNHTVDSCRIYDTGVGGMLLSGGNRKKLIPANNTVNNCYFTRTNRLEKACKGAVNMMGVGNRVTHCEMHDLTGFAIYFYGNDHYIAYNRIHDVLHEVSDAGAIYAGRDMSQVGNVIEKNFIYHIRNPKKDALGVCAIYIDDYMLYNRIYGNYFYDIVSDGSFFFSTIYFTCGGLTSIANNILIDCIPGLDPNVHGNAYYFMREDPDVIPKVHTTDENSMRGVDISGDLYRQHYPYLYETYVNNYHPGNSYYNNQVYYHNYSFFENAEAMDFRFKKDAFMYNQPHPDFLVHDPVMGIDGEMVEMVRDLEFEKIGMYPTKEER